MQLIYCAGGNRKFAEIAISHGFKYGAQLPSTTYFPVYFADQNYKRPRYVDYISHLAMKRPNLATVLDWQEMRRLDEILMRAEEIAQYTDEVLLIPKVKGGIKLLPKTIGGKPIRLAYSVPTSYGGTDLGYDEFSGWNVHLLGGSPGNQMELRKEMNVVSADGNFLHMKAKWCEVWIGYSVKNNKIVNHWRQLQDIGLGGIKDAPYKAFEMSCKNFSEVVWD